MNKEIKLYKLIKSRLTKRTTEKLQKVEALEAMCTWKDEKISKLNSYINVLQKENAELKKLITALDVAKSAIEFRMRSDDACEMPFDEDLSEALKEIERLINQ